MIFALGQFGSSKWMLTLTSEYAPHVVSANLSKRKSIKLSFCHFSSHEKEKRTWLQLRKFVE